jgi:putative alpha-1,2-mannosidase
VIQLENGQRFTIEAKNQSDKNVYVQKAVLNGVELKRLYITQEDILKGGTLQFVMGSKPNKKRLGNN